VCHRGKSLLKFIPGNAVSVIFNGQGSLLKIKRYPNLRRSFVESILNLLKNNIRKRLVGCGKENKRVPLVKLDRTRPISFRHFSLLWFL
jgi:hypothetical protein